MQTLVKLLISVTIILVAVHIGRKFPTLGGLIATMPLTSLIVLLWLYHDRHGERDILAGYTKGAMWGILPSLLFFMVAFLCFSKGYSLPIVLSTSFGVWLLGAFVHQWLLG